MLYLKKTTKVLISLLLIFVIVFSFTFLKYEEVKAEVIAMTSFFLLFVACSVATGIVFNNTTSMDKSYSDFKLSDKFQEFKEIAQGSYSIASTYASIKYQEILEKKIALGESIDGFIGDTVELKTSLLDLVKEFFVDAGMVNHPVESPESPPIVTLPANDTVVVGGRTFKANVYSDGSFVELCEMITFGEGIEFPMPVFEMESRPGFFFDNTISFEIEHLTSDTFRYRYMINDGGYLDVSSWRTEAYNSEAVEVEVPTEYVFSPGHLASVYPGVVALPDYPESISYYPPTVGFFPTDSISVDLDGFFEGVGDLTRSISSDFARSFLDSLVNVGSTSLDRAISANSVPGTIAESPAVDIPILGDILGLLNSILSILSSILDAIKSFFDVSEFDLDFSDFKFPLKDRFPFSIPFDFYNAVKMFSKQVKEPAFVIDINTRNLKINHEIDISFMAFPLGFFRYIVTVWYGLILLNKTRNFIKW